MVYLKKKCLAASVLILTFIGFATSLTGNDLILERDVCESWIKYKFTNDVGKNIFVAYTDLSYEFVNKAYQIITEKGYLYNELRLKKVPRVNYLYDYMIYLFINLDISKAFVPEPLLFCKKYFELFDISCPATLRLLDFPVKNTQPVYELTDDNKLKLLGHFYFHWKQSDLNESYIIRYKNRNVYHPPPETKSSIIYFIDIIFARSYYGHMEEILKMVAFKKLYLYKKPEAFCEYVLPDTKNEDFP